MIKRTHLDGIDNALFWSLSDALDTLKERAMYGFYCDLIHEMDDTLKAPYNNENDKYRLELERMDESIVIELSKDTLLINYSNIDKTTIEKSYHTIYFYEYNNSGEDEITVEEEGDYFIFSEKLSEHIYCIEINDVKVDMLNS